VTRARPPAPRGRRGQLGCARFLDGRARSDPEGDGILNARIENRLMVPTDFSKLK